MLKNKVCLFLFVILIHTVSVGQSITLTAPDGSDVTIVRDEFGVPHIKAENENALFYAQGYAVAGDRLFQMESFRRVSLGRAAELVGDEYIDLDIQTRTMFYTKTERKKQFEELPDIFKKMFTNYTQGVNDYIDSAYTNPDKYMPVELILAGGIDKWEETHTIAVIQFLLRTFAQNGGEELERLVELQDNGWDWFNLNRPINDPNAPTTIPNGIIPQKSKWSYSGMLVDKSVVENLSTKKDKLKELSIKAGAPPKLGSFAVALNTNKSITENVMLFSAPQMTPPVKNETNIIHEVELKAPGFHAGGATLAGIPMVFIGHNEHHSWTMTSGQTDNCDVYIDSTFDASYSKYFYNDEWLEFEEFTDTVYNLEIPIEIKYYRTIHGPVFGDDLANNQVYSLKMSFWQNELTMLQYMYNNIKAESLESFEQALLYNPMNFNVMYADRNQNVKYWHTGWFQDRSDGVDPRLPHKGDGSEEWGGLIPFEELPVAENPEQGYFANWNNKPVSWWNNGDNIPWFDNTNYTQRVTKIFDYMNSFKKMDFDDFKGVNKAINDYGTYQQVVEFAENEIIDVNLVPPGQSGFIDRYFTPSPHKTDQWDLHINWKYKDMIFGESVSDINDKESIPIKFSLKQNYPNPFNPKTVISYQISVNSEVQLVIFDLLGREVVTLINEGQHAGKYHIEFDAGNLASGLYIYQLRAGNFIDSKKMILLK